MFRVLLLLAALPGDRPGDLYGKVVSEALERAQTRLAASTPLVFDHSRWEDPWIVRSEHYEVRTTKSFGQAAAVARDLEFMHAQFEALLGPTPPREARHAVWIAPDLATYNALGANAGDHSSLLGSFFASEKPERPVIAMQTNNATLLGMWVTHSATHQYLGEAFGERAPVWVAEGLASYFALFWDWRYGARELERLKSTRALLPLERLFDESLPAYRSAPDARFLELGMLFHFLLNSCEATRDGATGDPATGPFREFLRLAVRGGDTRSTDFAQSLEGTLDLLQDEFEGHVFEFK